MMADYPQEDESTRFYRIRCTKVMWVGGELIFASMSAVSLAVFSVASTAILIIPKGQWIFHFSDATTKYLSVYPDRTGDAVVQLLPINLYNQVTLPDVYKRQILMRRSYASAIHTRGSLLANRVPCSKRSDHRRVPIWKLCWTAK